MGGVAPRRRSRVSVPLRGRRRRFAVAVLASTLLACAAAARAQQPVRPAPDTVHGVPPIGGVPDTVRGVRPIRGVPDTAHGVRPIQKRDSAGAAADSARRPPRGRIVVHTAPAAAAAAGGEASGQTPTEHVVQPGETLWEIAARYLHDPHAWPLLFDANRALLAAPDRIRPGQRLVIPARGGERPAQAGRAAPAEGPGPPTPGARRPERTVPGAPRASKPVGAAAASRRTRFYPRPVSEAVPEAARSRPLVTAAEYRSAPWVAGREAVGVVARYGGVVGAPQVTTLGTTTTVHPHDAIYLTYAGAARPAAGDTLLLVRIDGRVGDDGRAWSPSALLRVTDAGGETLTATVEQQYRAVGEADVALVPPALPDLSATETEPVAEGATGTILGFEESHPVQRLGDDAFVDLGGAAGVSVGDELAVYEAPAQRGDGAAPLAELARLRVVRVTDRGATARVIAVSEASLRPGLPVRIVRRIR